MMRVDDDYDVKISGLAASKIEEVMLVGHERVKKKRREKRRAATFLMEDNDIQSMKRKRIQH
jgi:hypothetical protein